MSELEYFRKPLPAVRLAELHRTVPSVDEVGEVVGPLFDQLFRTFDEAGVAPDGLAVGSYSADGDGILAIAGALYEGTPPDGLAVRELPAEPDALCVVHLGSVDTIGDTWQALVRHVEELGLELAGSCREVYLEAPQDDPDSLVTELQQPVR